MHAAWGVGAGRVVGHVHSRPVLDTEQARHHEHDYQDAEPDPRPFDPARHPRRRITTLAHGCHYTGRAVRSALVAAKREPNALSWHDRGVRVLVVEDERLLADTIAAGLRRHAMAVDVAYDGDEALDRLGVNDYDVVVLDRDLPKISGDIVCSTLIESSSATRILMLTAAAAVSQRVAGLQLGADDYLTKPFAFAELTARVQALGRRARRASRVG